MPHERNDESLCILYPNCKIFMNASVGLKTTMFAVHIKYVQPNCKDGIILMLLIAIAAVADRPQNERGNAWRDMPPPPLLRLERRTLLNELQIFNNPQFGDIRVVQKDGEPWFVAVDVCRALEVQNSRDAVARLDNDEKDTVVLTDGIPGNPNKTIVNEPGLYSLVLGSRKPEAKAFRRWITHEVIPSIRKTGSYTFDGSSKELRAIFMLDNRTVQHEQRITALEGSMVVDYGQQRTLAAQVNTVVIQALGGAESPAYHDKNVRGRTYSECNRDIQRWFRVNSRNNIPKKRFDEAVEYIQRWRPSTNMTMIIRQANRQTQIYS